MGVMTLHIFYKTDFILNVNLTLKLNVNKTFQVRILIRTLSLYRKRANNIYIIKEHFHWQYSSSTLKNSHLNHWSCLHYEINILQIHTHICTLLFLTRESARKRYSVSERESEWRKHRHFSDDSSERLWLVNAFINSTASCVIGYNVRRCTNVSGSAPDNEYRFEFSS